MYGIYVYIDPPKKETTRPNVGKYGIHILASEDSPTTHANTFANNIYIIYYNYSTVWTPAFHPRRHIDTVALAMDEG